jgi:ActR/RegA family two-component response regulator
MGSVLVVDDDEDIRELSELLLGRAGFRVTVAASGAEARALSNAQTFDVAFIDYFLGAREFGCDLIAPLRARNPRTRIIVVSGLGMLSELARHAYASGADLVASKSDVDWVELARADETPPPQPVRPIVDLDALKRRAIHGAYLVHRRNVSATARALGMKRSNLQRILRKTPPPTLAEIGRRRADAHDRRRTGEFPPLARDHADEGRGPKGGKE